MDEFDAENEPVGRRLRAERPELSAIELDRVKQGVVAKAARQGGGGMNLRSRFVTGLLVLGLVGAGGGAVLAASGGSSSNGSSANSQYCPPSSPGAGKPKGGDGGNKCGQCPDNGSSDKKKCQCDDSNGKGDKKKCCDDSQGGSGDSGNGKDKGKGNDDKCKGGKS